MKLTLDIIWLEGRMLNCGCFYNLVAALGGLLPMTVTSLEDGPQLVFLQVCLRGCVGEEQLFFYHLTTKGNQAS